MGHRCAGCERRGVGCTAGTWLSLLADMGTPDPATIAYVESIGRIYTVRLDGSPPTQLTDADPNDGDVQELMPSWSPDGSMIAFVSVRYDPESESETRSITLINADGTGAHVITDPELQASQPAWSPDATRIAFTSERGYGGDVYLIDVVRGAESRAYSCSTSTPARSCS